MFTKKALHRAVISMGFVAAFSGGTAQALTVDGSFSGNWWEGSEKAGRGFLFEVTSTASSNLLIVNWFTYDANGNQIWLNGNVPIPESISTVTVPLIRQQGGSFGPEFQAANAQVNNWGEMTIDFQSCNDASVTYAGTDGSGSMTLKNLSHPQGSSCEVKTPFTACPSFSTAASVPGACILSGEITQDVTLTNNTIWLLQGGVFIGGDNTNSATVTIEPGTRVQGQGAADFLFVQRGSKLNAVGTPTSPIVFTGPSEQAAGEWAGLVMAGNAPVNGCNADVAVCEQFDEALQRPYGGNNTNDSSGTLKYVQIRYAGFQVAPDAELNGLTLLGVGAGTVVDYVQIHEGKDDGVEMFGGSVNLKHIVLTNVHDDSLDWGQGWVGKAQYVLIRQGGDADHGIEADNNEENFNSLPRSKPTLANITAIGTAGGGEGARLRRGTGVGIYNSIFGGFGAECLNIDSDETFANAGDPANLTGELVIQNSYVACGSNFDDNAEDPWAVSAWFNAQPGNVAADPQVQGFIPVMGSPVSTSGGNIPDAFFDQTDYSGAFRNMYDNWTQGWTHKVNDSNRVQF